MKRFLLAAIFCLAFTSHALAQDAAATAPASKEDVERYLQTMHSHDMMQNMIVAMAKPMHQMLHDQFLKQKDKLPADFETRMNKMMDEMMKDMPFDEMMQAMVPSYQKHLTKGDVDSLVAFYSSPTGQKVLRELPAIMGEAMEAMMPIMRRQMDTMNQRVQQEVADMIKNSQKKPDQATPGT
jgi:hypothetical protein